MIRRFIYILTLIFALVINPTVTEAKWLYHATKRSAAQKILRGGFSVKKMKPTTRFGKGVYTSESKSLALKEKPASDSVVVLKDTKRLWKYAIDTSRLTKDKLKRLSGDLDLRGNIRRGIIGPKLGRQVGKAASKTGNIVVYKSARGEGKNIFIPKRVYQKHPQILKPVKVVPSGKYNN